MLELRTFVLINVSYLLSIKLNLARQVRSLQGTQHVAYGKEPQSAAGYRIPPTGADQEGPEEHGGDQARPGGAEAGQDLGLRPEADGAGRILSPGCGSIDPMPIVNDWIHRFGSNTSTYYETIAR